MLSELHTRSISITKICGIFLFFFLPSLGYTAENPDDVLSYQFIPGIDLIYAATLDTIIEGPYSEQSTRVIESRFVYPDDSPSGEVSLTGLSYLSQRILEGQEVEVPVENREIYQFKTDSHGDFHGYETSAPEFGTGWSPMIHFPPFPHKSLPFDTRIEATLPIQGGFPTSIEGQYSILTRMIDPKNRILLVGASLTRSVAIPGDIPISVRYQEYETRFDMTKRLPVFSRTSTQSRMETPEGTFNIEIVAESELKQANVFPKQHLPTLHKQISELIRYKNQLQTIDSAKSYPILEKILTFSDYSPIPFLRETAKSIVNKYRFYKKLDENQARANEADPAPAFTGQSIQGKLIQFPPEKRKPTLLFFWALWWEPAEQALWQMEKLYQEYDGKIQIVGVNLDSALGIARRYLQQSEIQVPVLWDEGYPKEGIAFEYGVHTVPTIIIMDRRSRIVARDLRGEGLQELLDSLVR